VTSVSPGLPADKAGIRESDVITEIDGQKITSQAALLEVIANASVGSTVRMKGVRDGREMSVPVTITDRTQVMQASNTGGPNGGPDRNDQDESAQGRLGIRVQNITPEMSRQMRLPSPDGVYIASVEPDGAADDSGLTRGMIITRIVAGTQRFEIRNTE